MTIIKIYNLEIQINLSIHYCYQATSKDLKIIDSLPLPAAIWRGKAMGFSYVKLGEIHSAAIYAL